VHELQQRPAAMSTSARCRGPFHETRDGLRELRRDGAAGAGRCPALAMRSALTARRRLLLGMASSDHSGSPAGRFYRKVADADTDFRATERKESGHRLTV